MAVLCMAIHLFADVITNLQSAHIAPGSVNVVTKLGRRMSRIHKHAIIATFTIAAALILVGAVLICVRTFFKTMEIYVSYSAVRSGWTREVSLTIESAGGALGFDTENEYCASFDSDVNGPYLHYQSREARGVYPGSGSPTWHWGGFNVHIDRSLPWQLPMYITHYSVAVPYYVILLVLASNFTVWLSLFRRSRRVLKLRLCDKCGYDLRASRLQCPECGRTI